MGKGTLCSARVGWLKEKYRINPTIFLHWVLVHISCSITFVVGLRSPQVTDQEKPFDPRSAHERHK
jgi:hypothetical protein